MHDIVTPRSFDLSEPSRAAVSALAARRSQTWRLTLLMACVFVACAAFAIGSANARIADPDLATLLHGMALLKAAITAIGMAAVWWRLGSPILSTLAAAYVGCTAAASAGTGLVWTMSHLWAATLLFHGALIVFLILGLRDSFNANIGRTRC